MPVQLVYLFFTLTNSTFTVESNIERPTILCLFGWKLSDIRTYQGLQDSLKLIVNWILPTGSKANHASISPGFEGF